jgi:hypothetical protein
LKTRVFDQLRLYFGLSAGIDGFSLLFGVKLAGFKVMVPISENNNLFNTDKEATVSDLFVTRPLLFALGLLGVTYIAKLISNNRKKAETRNFLQSQALESL